MARAPPFSRRAMAAALVLVASLAVVADDQFEKDKKDCAPQLVALSPCLPYVGGTAKTPTMDCCTDIKKVLMASRKCLCLLVKYRNEPGLGVKIDAKLAIGLPAVCHAQSNISECPALLHLAPNSSDAKVFTDFVKGANTSSTIAANATATPASSSTKANGGGPPMRRSGSLPIIYAILVILFFLIFCPI